jgi:hypothetical protein
MCNSLSLLEVGGPSSFDTLLYIPENNVHLISQREEK